MPLVFDRSTLHLYFFFIRRKRPEEVLLHPRISAVIKIPGGLFMQAHAQAMVLASFAADSFALGTHWIYDTTTIDQQFGRITTLLAPMKGPITRPKSWAISPITGIRVLICSNILPPTTAISKGMNTPDPGNLLWPNTRDIRITPP